MYRKSLTIESCHYPRSPSWVQQSPREQRFYSPRRAISILITTALPSQPLESFNVPAQKSYFLPGLSSVHTFQPESSKIQLEIATNHAHHGRNFYASALLCSRPQSLAIRMNALMLWRTTDPFLAAGELKSLRLRASFSSVVVVVDFRIFNPLFPPKFSSDFEPFHQKHQLGIAV